MTTRFAGDADRMPFPLFADTAMTCIHRLIDHHQTSLRKTASYYLVHIVVAAAVAYAVTGSLHTALALSLLEPTVQMIFFYLHEKLWERRALRLQQTVSAA